MKQNKDGMAVNCYFFKEHRRGYRCDALYTNSYKKGCCTGCPFFRTEENYKEARQVAAERWFMAKMRRKN